MFYAYRILYTELTKKKVSKIIGAVCESYVITI